MQGYPFFLPQRVLSLRLLRLIEKQKSRNRERNQETERRYWRIGSISFTIAPCRFLYHSLTPVRHSSTLTHSSPRPPLPLSLSSFPPNYLRSKSLHTQRLNPSLSFRPLHSCLDLPVTISCSMCVYVISKLILCRVPRSWHVAYLTARVKLQELQMSSQQRQKHTHTLPLLHMSFSLA